MTTPAECFDKLAEALKTERKRTLGVNAVYQYHVTGTNGGDWWIKADNGTGDVGSGQHDNPTMSVEVDEETFVGVATGAINGQNAFFEGKMKVDGDARQGMWLGQVFGQA